MGHKIAIKMFIHPEFPQIDPSIDQNDPVVQKQLSQQQDYESSMSHFYTEQKYLSKLNHKNIVKIHESQRSVEINIPSYLKQTVRKVDT